MNTEWQSIDSVEQQLNLFKRNRTSGFSSLEDLRGTMHEYVLTAWNRLCGVRLKVLEVRFSVSANDFGSSVREIAEDFIRSGEITAREHRGEVILIPQPQLRNWIELLNAEARSAKAKGRSLPNLDTILKAAEWSVEGAFREPELLYDHG